MKINKFVGAIYALILSFGVLIVPINLVSAVNVTEDSCKIDSNSALCKNSGDNIQPIINTVVNTLLYILGIIAIIMIIIGGFRYTLSGGDTKAVSDAKNSILYAVIGLVVAFSAYAVVNWVLKLFPG